MVTRLLSDVEYHATFAERMRELTADDSANEIDIWPYVEAIPEVDLATFSIAGQDVERVYRSGDEHFDHAMIPTTTKNVYLVIVVDLFVARIAGHHVLNLNEKYGMATPPTG